MGEERTGQLQEPERRSRGAFAHGAGVLDGPLDREREPAFPIEAALKGKTQHEVRGALRLSVDLERAGQGHLARAPQGLGAGRGMLEQRLRGRYVR